MGLIQRCGVYHMCDRAQGNGQRNAYLALIRAVLIRALLAGFGYVGRYHVGIYP